MSAFEGVNAWEDGNNNTPTYIDKYTQLAYISIGFAVAWPVIGIPLALYVYSQTKDEVSKLEYSMAAFFLTGLALFFMWLLWFSMYSAQNYPQIHIIAKCQKPYNEVCEE